MSHKASMTSFTQEELFRLMAYMRKYDPQMHTVCLLALWHGLRRGEVLKLTSHNFVDGRIVFSRLKNSNSSNHKLMYHHVPEFNEVQAIQSILRVRNDGRVLFDISERQANRLLVKYCDAVEIHRTKAHMHSFKHSCCKMLLPHLGLAELQVYVGHKEGKNTMRYLQTDQETVEAKLEAAISAGASKGATYEQS
jgi:integrase